MASTVAKRAAGTYVEDTRSTLPPVHIWALVQCRRGNLAEAVRLFCAEQPEILDPALVLVDNLTSECIQCRIPCRLYDHESDHPYNSEVRFMLNPVTGKTRRCD